MNLQKNFFGLDSEYFAKAGCTLTSVEIAGQPETWLSLCDLLEDNAAKIRSFFERFSLDGRRIVLTGAGSSGFVASMLSCHIAERFGILSDAIHTTDIVSSPNAFIKDVPTLLISFGRSGNSPESVGAVQACRKLVSDLYEITIVCDGNSKLSNCAKESDKSLLLVMPEGANDKAFAMTCSVSCMLLAGFAVFGIDKLSGITRDIALLSDYVANSSQALSKVAQDVAGLDVERLWYIGCGSAQALMREGALKVMEVTNGKIVAGSNNAPEFRHGPKTVINSKAATIHFVSNNDFTAQYDNDLLDEILSQRDKNKVVSITGTNNSSDFCVKYDVSGYEILGDVAAEIFALVFMQMFSVFASIKLGVPTDNPSPSGHVNRVVQGVTIYPIK